MPIEQEKSHKAPKILFCVVFIVAVEWMVWDAEQNHNHVKILHALHPFAAN